MRDSNSSRRKEEDDPFADNRVLGSRRSFDFDSSDQQEAKCSRSQLGRKVSGLEGGPSSRGSVCSCTPKGKHAHTTLNKNSLKDKYPPQPQKVFINGLSRKIRQEILLEAFEKFGGVRSLKIRFKKLNKTEIGCGFVVFDDAKVGKYLIDDVGSTEILGQVVTFRAFERRNRVKEKIGLPLAKEFQIPNCPYRGECVDMQISPCKELHEDPEVSNSMERTTNFNHSNQQTNKVYLFLPSKWHIYRPTIKKFFLIRKSIQVEENENNLRFNTATAKYRQIEKE